MTPEEIASWYELEWHVASRPRTYRHDPKPDPDLVALLELVRESLESS